MGDNFNTQGNGKQTGQFRDYPRRASLLEELYEPLPGVTAAIDSEKLDLDKIAGALIQELASALGDNDRQRCRNLFYESQAYYRDAFAMTYHRRTFKTPETICLALLKLNKDRKTEGFALTPGSQYMSVLPNLVRVHAL